MAKKTKYNRILLVSLFFVSSVIFLGLFSWNTSPIIQFGGYDSSIFKSIGLFTAKGLTPYNDFFDHKGPVIVFVEWLGYGLTKSDFTLFLLQSVFLTFALYGVFKIAKLFLSTKKSALITIVTLPVCSFFMSGQSGNIVEEWILPFLVWCSYFAVKFFAYKEKEFNYKYSILYGVTFAIAAFSRLTNAVPIIIIGLVVLVFLIKQKEWKNILKNALAFVVGTLIITIPIINWFVVNGALKEMLYSTFVFNYKYVKVRSLVPDIMRILRHTARYLLPIIFAIVLQIAMIVKKKDMWLNVALLIQSVVAIIMQVTSALFPHYLYIWVPTIMITLILAVKDYGIMKLFVRGYVTLLVIVFIGTNFIAFKRYHDYLGNNYKNYVKMCKDVGRNIPDKSKKIVSIGSNPYFYLVTDTVPCYKYFHTQDLHSTYDPKTKKEWEELLKSKKADYIVVNNMGEYPSYRIIRKDYKLLYRNQYFALLEKK
ncbi:MAG: hypothetical protein K6E58_01235 [Eubacterium sp.]|nr:hypothetical protein [Eubacterium sp.]